MADTNDEQSDEWWVCATFGTGPYRMPPRGPWRGRRTAELALDRWAQHAGYLAGTITAAHSVRLRGPYRTRAKALNDDGQ